MAPYYAYGDSNAYPDDDRSADVATTIWGVVITLFGMEYATAGALLSAAASFYPLVTADLSKPGVAYTYCAYTWDNTDVNFYRNGSWWTGVRVEEMRTYGWGWAMFRDENGNPYSAADGAEMWEVEVDLAS